MSVDAGAMIWCPFPDADTARHAAEHLLAEKLIACANILPGMTSIYRWEGEIEDGAETGVLFKTTQAKLKSAVKRLESLHPYDTPAIMGWSVDAVAPATLDWLANQLPSEGSQ